MLVLTKDTQTFVGQIRTIFISWMAVIKEMKAKLNHVWPLA